MTQWASLESANAKGKSGGIIKMFRDDLQHFQPPTQDQDGNRYSDKQIEKMQNFASRANMAYAYVRQNGFPLGTEKYVEQLKERILAHRGNASLANLEEIYALDTTVGYVIRDSDVFGKLGIPTEIMSRPRFEQKEYMAETEGKVQFTTTFKNPTFLRLKSTSQFANGVGLNVGVELSWQDIAESEGGLWDPKSVLMMEAAELMGIQKSRRGFLGTACADNYSDDGLKATNWGITGLYNYASNQTFEAGIGGDDNVQDQGDMEFTMRAGFTKFRTVRQPGKFVVVSTGGLASHMFYERDTYQQQLDLARVKEFLSMVPQGAWGGWWVTEQLYASAAAANKQQLMILKVGPTTLRKKIIYNTQWLPMYGKYPQDFVENLVYADILQIKKVNTAINAVPIAIAADITADGTGFIPDGTKIF